MEQRTITFLFLFFHTFLPPIIHAQLSSKRPFCITFKSATGDPGSAFFTEIPGNLFTQDCLYVPNLKARVFAVQDERRNKNKYILARWLHYKLPIQPLREMSNPPSNGDNIQGIILQVDSDKYGGFGEFVEPGELGIDKVQFRLDALQAASFVPCDVHSSISATGSNVIAYTRSGDSIPGWTVQPNPFQTKDLSVLWRFNGHNLCNDPEYIIFRGIVFMGDSINSTTAYLIPPLQVKFKTSIFSYGHAASPFPPPGKQNNLNIEATATPGTVDWIDSIEFPGSRPITRAECVAPTQPQSFGCLQIPTCRFTGNKPALAATPLGRELAKNHRDFKEYREYVHERVKFYCQCPIPSKIAQTEPPLSLRPNAANQDAPQNDTGAQFTTPKPYPGYELDDYLRGPDLRKFPGGDAYNFRVVHGLAHTIDGLFVTPVGIFMARHYKETFMKDTVIFNKAWYIAHLLMVFINFQLHLYGYFAMFLSQSIVGKSLSTNPMVTMFHSYGGYLHTALLLFLTLFGGVRTYAACCRGIFILCHWALGLAYYFGTLALLISSSCIHGSPSNQEIKRSQYSDTAPPFYCLRFLNPTAYRARKTVSGQGDYDMYFPLVIVIWVSLDVAFHIAMDCMRICIERSDAVKIDRGCTIVPYPVLNEYNRTDIPGSTLRKFVLIIYILTASGFCLTGVIMILIKPHLRTGFGMMSCTHNNSRQDSYDPTLLSNCNRTIFLKQILILRGVITVPLPWDLIGIKGNGF